MACWLWRTFLQCLYWDDAKIRTKHEPTKDCWDEQRLWVRISLTLTRKIGALVTGTVYEAEKWMVSPNLSSHLVDDSRGSTMGFSSRMHPMDKALEMSFEVQFMKDFCVSWKIWSWWFVKSSMVILTSIFTALISSPSYHTHCSQPGAHICSHVIWILSLWASKQPT